MFTKCLHGDLSRLSDIFIRYYLACNARRIWSIARGACCREETESRVPLSEVSFRTDGCRRWRTDFIYPRGIAESSFGRLHHGTSPGNKVCRRYFNSNARPFFFQTIQFYKINFWKELIKESIYIFIKLFVETNQCDRNNLKACKELISYIDMSKSL
jgi:hypothetical protein